MRGQRSLRRRLSRNRPQRFVREAGEFVVTGNRGKTSQHSGRFAIDDERFQRMPQQADVVRVGSPIEESAATFVAAGDDRLARQLLGHHFVDDVAGDVEGVEVRRRHGNLIVDQTAHFLIALDTVRHAATGPVVAKHDALQRSQRERPQAIVAENARRAQRR